VAAPPLVLPHDDEPTLAGLPPVTPAKAGVETPVSQGLVAASTPAAATAIFQSGLAALPASVNPMEVMLIFQQALKAWFGGGSTQASSAPAIAGSLPEASAAAAPPGNSPN
jgi:hypothetical protein